MSTGTMLLTVLSVLIFCGLLQRVLDRMYLTDRMALLLTGLMLLGTFLPNIRLGAVEVNLGGAAIPLGVCVWLFVHADESIERWRTLLGTVLTAAAVYALSLLLPAEAEQLPMDPMWLCGAVGGLFAWVLGRSRRGAFICGVAGVLLADAVSGVTVWARGIDQLLILGGAGVADAAVVSGVLAVFLCELAGETAERIVRGKMTERERDRS